MRTRTWSLVAAALLIGGLGVAFATTVSGQAFEHHADVTDAGTAYTIDWRQEDPGKLRLQFDPVDQAAEPSATLSLFSPGHDLVGTYEMDADWRQLDYVIQEPGEHTLVVHKATGANIQILTEDDARADVEEASLQRDTVTLLEGERQAVAYQMAIDPDTRLAHMGVVFQGQASELAVEVLGQDDEIILEGSAPSLDIDQAQALGATLAPAELDQDQLLVRLEAQSLNGTVALELLSFPEEHPEVFSVHSQADGSNDTEEANDTESDDGNGTEANQSAEASWEPPIDGVVVSELEPGTPVGFSVPAGVESVYLIAEDDCAYGTVYGADDQVIASQIISEEEGMIWNEEENLVAIEVPVSQDGEHVALLTENHDPGKLFIPGIESADLVEARELEVEETTLTFEQEASLFSGNESQSQATNLTSGLIGFSFRTQDGADIAREISLYGPEGEELYSSTSMASSYGFRVVSDGYSQDGPVVGPTGEYTVETDGSSPTGSTIETTLYHYVHGETSAATGS